MKHDETLSNDPELEARIVAWVMGEASPFEAAELSRHLNEQPELAVFKRRIEAVHGLLGEASRPAPAGLQLSPERRAKLLATIGAPSAASLQPGAVIAVRALHHRRWWHVPTWAYSAAACVLLCFVTWLVISNRYEAAYYEPRSSHGILLKNPDASETPSVLDRIFKRKELQARAEKRTSMEQEYKARAIAMNEEAAKRVAADAVESSETRKKEASSVRGVRITLPAVSTGVQLDAVAAAAPRPETEWGTRAGRSEVSTAGDSTFRYAATDRSAGYYGGSAPRADAPAVNLSFGGNTFGRQSSAAGAVTLNAPAVSDRKTPVRTQAPLFGAGAVSQGAAPSGALQLSAFEVAANDGLRANTTLAGSRVNSQLQDFASSIRVVTKQELKDLPFGGNEAASAPATAGLPASADKPVVHPAPAPVESLRQEVPTQQQPISTFSLHVSDVSFRLAVAAMNRGERPDAASIRPEEFYNAFDYGDPSAAAGEPVACRIEQSAHPFLPQRNLVRIALKVPATGRSAGQPLRLTVLLDTSGSMERDDRVATVRRAFERLAELLQPQDSVTLIGFARTPRLLAERLSGDQKKMLVDYVAATPAEGGTNLEEALKLAARKAVEQFDGAAQNRVIVLSDGAANLGNDNPARLAEQVLALRQQGIAFDACGVGAEGLDDSVLEALTRKGDGRYYVINSPEEADAGFARKLAGAFRPAAENVKVQVRFNPARVGSYRLIGFEQHRLNTEDFRNDKVDAAELAADEAAVALYEVQVKPEGDGELGDVFVRFRNAADQTMVERSWTLSYAPQAPSFDRASSSLQLAGTAAYLAEKLRGGAAATQIRLSDFAPMVNRLRGEYPRDPTVQDLVTLFGQTRRLLGE